MYLRRGGAGDPALARPLFGRAKTADRRALCRRFRAFLDGLDLAIRERDRQLAHRLRELASLRRLARSWRAGRTARPVNSPRSDHLPDVRLRIPRTGRCPVAERP